MFFTNSLNLFDFAIFNAFLVKTVTCLKYPLSYQRRVANRRPIARVIDGEDADRYEYAYVVAIEKFPGDYIPSLNFTQYRKCTGSLINKHFVISATHCSKGAERIRYGDLTVPSWSTRATHSNVIRKFIHIKFEGHGDRIDPNERMKDIRIFANNDIALYKVEPVHLSKYAVLSAVDYKTLTGVPVKYVGCGLSAFPEMNLTEIKKRIVEDDTRERQIGYAVVKPCGKFSSTVIIYPLICVARKCKSNQESSSGDSGGPLLYDGKIVGVHCGGPPMDGLFQSAYTPVSLYLDWITQVVNTEN